MKQLLGRYLRLFLLALVGVMPIAHGAQETINRGTTAGDGSGETLYSAFGKVNSNFTDLYTNYSTLFGLTAYAPLASPTFTGTVGGITKGMVELGNVDNTSDANKPVSTAVAAALPQFYSAAASFPASGTSNVLYVANDTGLAYRWNGSVYVSVGSGFGPNTFTVGNGGQYATLSAALTARAALPNTLLVTTSTGSVTGTSSGSVDVRKITVTGDVLGPYLNLKNIGVRIGGSGPIVRAYIRSANEIQTRYPIPQDYSAGTQIDVYEIVPATILVTPGTVLDESGANLIIPAFTSITTIGKGAATIRKTGSGTVLFYTDPTQNEISFSNLVLQDARTTSGSRFWQIPGVGTHPLSVMCDFYLENNIIDTASQDFVYVGLGAFGTTDNGGGLSVRDNSIRGRFDVIFFGNMRYADISNNYISIQSLSESLDTGNPTGVAFGGSLSDWLYPSQAMSIRGNTMHIEARAQIGAGDASVAYGVEFRGGILASPAKVSIKNNDITVSLLNGTGNAAGVSVTGLNGAAAPYVEVMSNTFNVTSSASGTAYMIDSALATTPLRRANNTAVPGSVTAIGLNAPALTMY